MLTKDELDGLALDLCPPDPEHLVVTDGSPDFAPCPKCGGTDNGGVGTGAMIAYDCENCGITFTAVSKAALGEYRERQERLCRLIAQAAEAPKLVERERELLRQLELCGCRLCDAPACNCGGYHNNAAEVSRQTADKLAAECAALREALDFARIYIERYEDERRCPAGAEKAMGVSLAYRAMCNAVRAALSSPSPAVARVEAERQVGIAWLDGRDPAEIAGNIEANAAEQSAEVPLDNPHYGAASRRIVERDLRLARALRNLAALRALEEK